MLKNVSGECSYEVKLSKSKEKYGIVQHYVREHTMAFKNPENGHIYVALTSQIFQKCIYSWIGAAQDCYVLCSSLAEGKLSPFSQDRIEQLVCDSDEDTDRIDRDSQEIGSKSRRNESHVKQFKFQSDSDDEIDDDIVLPRMKKAPSSYMHDSDVDI